MQGNAFNPFGWTDVPEYIAEDLEASKVTTLWSPTREASIAHNTLSWLGDLPPLQKAFLPSVGQSASERLSSKPPWMFGPNTTGRFYASSQVYVSGVFKKSTGSDNQRILNSNQSDVSNTTFDFSLNNNQAIYQGDKLQPSALQTLACIKFWCKAAPEALQVEASYQSTFQMTYLH